MKLDEYLYDMLLKRFVKLDGYLYDMLLKRFVKLDEYLYDMLLKRFPECLFMKKLNSEKAQSTVGIFCYNSLFFSDVYFYNKIVGSFKMVTISSRLYPISSKVQF